MQAKKKRERKREKRKKEKSSPVHLHSNFSTVPLCPTGADYRYIGFVRMQHTGNAISIVI